MSFAADLQRFTVKIEAKTPVILGNFVSGLYESIVDGSPITGSPGQPVDTGALRASWQVEFQSPTEATISTAVEYAPVIEENLRGAHFRNHGAHSVALSVAGAPRLLESVAQAAA